MPDLKAVIADDEENIRLGLAAMLARLWPELDICGQAANGNEALELIRSSRPDIAFLDIQMPGQTGLEVARQTLSACKIVFVTAYDHFAVQAFESEAVDYVLKPVTEERLKKTIARLQKQFVREIDYPQTGPDLLKVIRMLEHHDAPEYLRLIKVKVGAELRFVPVSEILYFKAEDKYTTVRTATAELLIRTPIKVLEQELNPDQFWRVHRSAIVNIDRIEKIKRSFTNQMMIGFPGIKDTVSVSRAYEHLFRQM